MNELWKQERHFTNMRHSGVNFDNNIKKKYIELFSFIGNEWNEELKKWTTLNIGCGPLPLRFNSKVEFGLDPLIDSYKKMKYPEKYYRGMKLIKGFINDIDIENDSIDFAYCRKALEYVSEWEESLKEIHRVLKKGGYLVLIYHTVQYDGINLNLLERINMEEHLKSIGFSIMKFERYDDSLTKVLSIKR